MDDGFNMNCKQCAEHVETLSLEEAACLMPPRRGSDPGASDLRGAAGCVNQS